MFTERHRNQSSQSSSLLECAAPASPKLSMTLVGELVTHISLHRGLDPHGRIHPSRQRLPLAEVEVAIGFVESAGLVRGLMPYHLDPSPQGTWQEPHTVREVLRKKLDQVQQQEFGGDLIAMCLGLTQRHIREPLMEQVMGREVAVKMSHVAGLSHDSPYHAVQEYLAAIGKSSEFSWLKPYHMAKTSQAYLSNDVVDQLLLKWFDQMVVERFSGSLFDMCIGLCKRHLQQPYREAISSRTIEITMGSIGQAFGENRFMMVRRYLELKGNAEDFSWFRPYHMSEVPLGTWRDSKNVDVALEKLCDQLITDRFEDDFERFSREVSSDQLKAPLTERFAGREIVVSMRKVAALYNDSPRAMVA